MIKLMWLMPTNDDDDEEDTGLALTPFNVRIFMAFFFCFVLFFDGIFLVSFLIQKKSYTIENFFLA